MNTHTMEPNYSDAAELALRIAALPYGDPDEYRLREYMQHAIRAALRWALAGNARHGYANVVNYLEYELIEAARRAGGAWDEYQRYAGHALECQKAWHDESLPFGERIAQWRQDAECRRQRDEYRAIAMRDMQALFAWDSPDALDCALMNWGI